MPLKIITDKSPAIYDVYLKHCEEKKLEPFTKLEYVQILKLYGEYAGEELLKGNKIELGGQMGAVHIERIKSEHKKPSLNWEECTYDEDGKVVEKVYYDNVWRYFFHWTKPMKGGNLFKGMRFIPSKGKKTSVYNWRERLNQYLKEHPLNGESFKLIRKIAYINGYLDGQRIVRVTQWKKLMTDYGYTSSELIKIKACAYGWKKEVDGYTWDIEYKK